MQWKFFRKNQEDLPGAQATLMGLYYSYYKTIINAPSFYNGLLQITNDNVTEYGHTINTLKRFNLLSRAMNWKTERCWITNRGEELSPVESCEGIGNPHYFYTDLPCSLLLVLRLDGYLSLVHLSVLGGAIAVSAFAFNHGEATRVQWTPPLRESFAFPMIIAQIAVVTYILKNHRSGPFYVLTMAVFGCLSLLFWQFSQFAFFTQVGSLFVVYTSDFIPRRTMETLLKGHL
ncbi:hypothetical protein OSTOST_18214, partial [Ostertagia ostertagi]